MVKVGSSRSYGARGLECSTGAKSRRTKIPGLLPWAESIPPLRIPFQPAISVVETQAQSTLEKPIFTRA
jgi:hypothetical protein